MQPPPRRLLARLTRRVCPCYYRIMTCTVADCETAAWSRGFCPKHLYRFKKYGDPLVTKYTPPGAKLAFLEWASSTETDACILHEFPVGNHGYMMVNYKQSQMLGHHVILVLQGRSLPIGLEETRHLCDDKRCLNGKHLKVGKPQDNADDRKKYGKVSQGEERPGSKLTDEAVRAIRAEPKIHGAMGALCIKYGVTREVIRRVRNGTSWKHVK